MVALSDLLLWLIIRRASRKREYLSGYAVNIQHHEAWTERVVIQEAYTDGNGKTRHRTVIRYHYHPDIWFMKLNTGVEVHVSESVYDRYRMIWGTERTEIYPYHPNCVGGGGGQLYEWNGVYADAGTSTYNGLYVNYVINSNSMSSALLIILILMTLRRMSYYVPTIYLRGCRFLKIFRENISCSMLSQARISRYMHSYLSLMLPEESRRL